MKQNKSHQLYLLSLGLVLAAVITVSLGIVARGVSAQSQPVQSGSVGIEGTISSPPPTTAASITLPANGQSFTSLPITVAGICPGDVLIKLFKNNVFSGSVQCASRSYSIQTDLFSGRNDLVVRVYDALDQAGPDSNAVTVNFVDGRFSATGSRVTLTSNYAKRGANPGEKLGWPMILSGGSGPYAISIDWGDGKPPDLLSQPFPGTFAPTHVYDSPGVYNIIVKASDKDGVSAFLQLVGVANGPLGQDTSKNNDKTTIVTRTRIVWWPAAVALPLLILAFWLGKRYGLHIFRRRLEQHL